MSLAFSVHSAPGIYSEGSSLYRRSGCSQKRCLRLPAHAAGQPLMNISMERAMTKPGGETMSFAANAVIALIALLHIYILVLEMFLRDKPAGLRALGSSSWSRRNERHNILPVLRPDRRFVRSRHCQPENFAYPGRSGRCRLGTCAAVLATIPKASHVLSNRTLYRLKQISFLERK